MGNVGLMLAAGHSRRMQGDDKLLKEIDGVPLLRRSVLSMLRSNIDQVFVVVGQNCQQHINVLVELDVTICQVIEPSYGLSTSIRSGILAIPDHAKTISICLADMPDISSKHYNALLDAHDINKNRKIIFPVSPLGKRGHPVLFDGIFKNELCSLTGDRGAKQIIDAHRDEVWQVAVEDGSILTDLDTPEAWSKWEQAREKKM